jgi:hypothetical protein
VAQARPICDAWCVRSRLAAVAFVVATTGCATQSSALISVTSDRPVTVLDAYGGEPLCKTTPCLVRVENGSQPARWVLEEDGSEIARVDVARTDVREPFRGTGQIAGLGGTMLGTGLVSLAGAACCAGPAAPFIPPAIVLAVGLAGCGALSAVAGAGVCCLAAALGPLEMVAGDSFVAPDKVHIDVDARTVTTTPRTKSTLTSSKRTARERSERPTAGVRFSRATAVRY